MDSDWDRIGGMTCFHYPLGAERGAIHLTIRDINCLKRGTFLTDQMVDFWLRYFHAEKLDSSVKKGIYVFSSLFYNSLVHFSTSKPSRWTRKIRNFFDLDFLVIPIVTNKHWLLAIICYPGAAKSKDSSETEPQAKRMKTDQNIATSAATATTFPGVGRSLSSSNEVSLENQLETKPPLILILDSFQEYGVNHSAIAADLRSFLSTEWMVRNGSVFQFTAENMPFQTPVVPQQRNLSDCGVYTLQFFETFFSKPLSTWLSTFLSLSLDWFYSFTKELEKDKREQIYQAILSILRAHAGYAGLLVILPSTSAKLPVTGISLNVVSAVQAEGQRRRAEELRTVVKFFFARNSGLHCPPDNPIPSNPPASTEFSLPVNPCPRIVDVDKAQASMNVDASQPVTKIYIRMADGSRLAVTLNRSQPISQIREFICTAMPDQAEKPFTLMTTFPNTELKDESVSLDAANLVNTLVVQRMDQFK